MARATVSTNPCQDLVIDVGRLSSIPQLVGRIARSLQLFSERWRQDARCRVVWDLRGAARGSIDPAAVATFCAAAKRLRQFTWTKPLALAPDLTAQRFLHGIGFFDLVREDDLFDFQTGSIGGYKVPEFHPATHLFSIRRIAEMIPQTQNADRLAAWKDQCREEFRQQMLYSHDCYRLFVPGQLPRPLDPSLVNAILNCCAEFATNAVLWGKADAFVAVQVGSRTFSAAVCDAGDGLLRTLCAKREGRLRRVPLDDHEATFFASLYNRHAMGLFRTIEGVLKRHGTVTISTGISEVRWQPALWRRVQIAIEQDGHAIFQPGAAERLLGPIVRGHADPEQYAEGIRREWIPGLRGTRIAFQLPYEDFSR